MPLTRTPTVVMHGRYLIERGVLPNAPLLVGFHGYAETADTQLARLRSIPGADRWAAVSVQGLHRFYRGRGPDRSVVASWMTRQDRDLAIADNLAYVGSVLDEAIREHGAILPVVFAGFSQGVAMAFRAAASLAIDIGGVLAVGGDVPPDVSDASLGRIPRALIGRGGSDVFYSQDQFAADVDRLRAAGGEVETLAFDGGHDWTPAFSEAAGGFLSRVRTAAP